MADRTVLLEELLIHPRLRDRSYEVQEPSGTGLVCLDLSARSGPDWLFARRWVNVRAGRRLLFRTIDRVETAGFTFRIHASTGLPRDPIGAADPWVRASAFYEELDDVERSVHDELFPQEAGLLRAGYDWDAEHVYRHGKPLEADAFGRFVETDGDHVWEWVRVSDEFTWRRYPLERLTSPAWLPGT